MRRKLLSRGCAVELRALHELVASSSRFNWQATGRAAAFELVALDGHYPSGWTRIRFEFEQEDLRPARARFSLDRGRGYNEQSSTMLPRSRFGAVEALLCLPDDIRAIRLSPTNRPGRFRIGDLRVEELSLYETVVAVMRHNARRAAKHPVRVRKLVASAIGLWRADGFEQLLSRLEANALSEIDGGRDYLTWVDTFDTLDEKDRFSIKRRIEVLPLQPLISVVMTVQDSPVQQLRAAIDSVRSQLYAKWELCIAAGRSCGSDVTDLLRELATRDPRVKYVMGPDVPNAPAASGHVLALSRGALIVPLDPRDELHEQGLFQVVQEFNARPHAAIIYSDEDTIDDAGVRQDPCFKPDWDPELFRSQNFIGRLVAYSTELLKAVGGFTIHDEGSLDYDVALRIVERVPPDRIRHITRVLYHRRSSPRTPAQRSASDLAARRSIQSHLERIGSAATVKPGPAVGLHRVRYPSPEPPPLVSIIIPTRDGVSLLRRCVDSIVARTTYPSFELIIVDNGSTDRQTLDYVSELQGRGVATLLGFPGPFNYSAINNAAVQVAKGSLLAFLNNDLEVLEPEWLTEMVSHAVRPEVGVVGAKLYFPDDSIQHAGIVVGMGAHGVAGTPHRGLARDSTGYFGRACCVQSLSAVTAACMVLRRETFESVGGFNEVALPIAFNDVDLCLRLRERGLRVVLTPYAELYHYESASRGTDDTAEKRARLEKEATAMRERHRIVLAADPFYNPNLSLESDDFSLAWPPRVPFA